MANTFHRSKPLLDLVVVVHDLIGGFQFAFEFIRRRAVPNGSDRDYAG